MRGICARQLRHDWLAAGIVIGTSILATTMATIAASANGAEPSHPEPDLPSCVNTAKVKKSTPADPFTVRYRLRCDFSVSSITLDTTKQLTQVQAAPKIDPATAGSFRCKRAKPRKVSCSGTAELPNTLIVISLRVKPGPCKKPRLRMSGAAEGVTYCPIGPCTAGIVGVKLSTTPTGC